MKNLKRLFIILMLISCIGFEVYLAFSPLHEKCAASHYAKNECIFNEGFECEQLRLAMDDSCQEFHKEAVNALVFINLMLFAVFVMWMCYEAQRRY